MHATLLSCEEKILTCSLLLRHEVIHTPERTACDMLSVHISALMILIPSSDSQSFNSITSMHLRDKLLSGPTSFKLNIRQQIDDRTVYKIFKSLSLLHGLLLLHQAFSKKNPNLSFSIVCLLLFIEW